MLPLYQRPPGLKEIGLKGFLGEKRGILPRDTLVHLAGGPKLTKCAVVTWVKRDLMFCISSKQIDMSSGLRPIQWKPLRALDKADVLRDSVKTC